MSGGFSPAFFFGGTMKLFLFIMLFSSLSFAQTLNNCRITNQSLFGATTIATQGLPMKANRRCLVIQNATAGTTIYVTFDSSATPTSAGVALTGGTIWAPSVIPMNAIFISSGSAKGGTTMLMQGE